MRLNVARTVVVVAAAFASFAPSTVAAVAATAATPTADVGTLDVPVTTTTGQHLKMILAVSASGSHTQALVIVHHGPLGSAPEQHLWTFPVSRASMAFNGSSGHANVGSQLAPYGTFSLSFTKVSTTTKQCANQAKQPTQVTTTKVRLSGVVNLALRNPNAASSWGSIRLGSASAPYAFSGYSRYIATTNGSCGVSNTAAAPPTCYSGWTWWPAPDVYVVSGGSIANGTSSLSGVYLSRTVTLTQPAGASRFDYMAIAVPPLTVSTNGAATTLTVRTASTSSGTATLRISGAATPQVQTFSCRVRGSSTAHQEVLRTWYVDWRNGNTPFAVTPVIGAAIKVPTGTKTWVTQEAYS